MKWVLLLLLCLSCRPYHIRRANAHLLKAQLKGAIIELDTTVQRFKVIQVRDTSRGFYFEWHKTKQGKIKMH